MYYTFPSNNPLITGPDPYLYEFRPAEYAHMGAMGAWYDIILSGVKSVVSAVIPYGSEVVRGAEAIVKAFSSGGEPVDAGRVVTGPNGLETQPGSGAQGLSIAQFLGWGLWRERRRVNTRAITALRSSAWPWTVDEGRLRSRALSAVQAYMATAGVAAPTYTHGRLLVVRNPQMGDVPIGFTLPVGVSAPALGAMGDSFYERVQRDAEARAAAQAAQAQAAQAQASGTATADGMWVSLNEDLARRLTMSQDEWRAFLRSMTTSDPGYAYAARSRVVSSEAPEGVLAPLEQPSAGIGTVGLLAVAAVVSKLLGVW